MYDLRMYITPTFSQNHTCLFWRARAPCIQYTAFTWKRGDCGVNKNKSPSESPSALVRPLLQPLCLRSALSSLIADEKIFVSHGP